jgi:hypothetical protein
MIPIGDPFDEPECGRASGGDDDLRGPGQATPAPARTACRPLLSARRAGPPRR